MASELWYMFIDGCWSRGIEKLGGKITILFIYKLLRKYRLQLIVGRS